MGHFSPLLVRASESELRDPRNPAYSEEFLRGWQSARTHKRTLSPYISGRTVSLNEAKNLLAQGIPLTMEINVYYGAWNTSSAPAMGIERSERAFALGEVNYPEKGTADRAISPTKTARHAVVIIGYDDAVEMTYEKKMADGTTKTFTRRGVFYFKNSWGTNRFGASFRLEGKRIPGFGLITQAYAGEFGKFTAIQLGADAEILEK